MHSIGLLSLLVLVLACVGLSTADVPTLVILPSGTAAQCLDGTPPGYYWQAASTPESRNNWVIFFQGWCYTPEECLQRAGTSFGSSKFWAPSASFQGVMSDSPTTNPDFYSWNKAYFKYCDGASFSGDAKGLVGNTTLFYQGHAILHALLDALNARGLQSASQVLVSGCSAGGLATFLHLDEIRSLIPSAAVVKGMPGSGYFMDIPNMDGDPVYPDQMASVFAFQNCAAGVNQACIAHYAATGDQSQCMFAPSTYPFIQTPIFIVNSDTDSWQTINILGITARCALEGPTNCTEAQIQNITVFSHEMVHSITSASTFSQEGNGVFIQSCMGHCAETLNHGWTKTKVSGVIMNQAVGDWFFDRPNTNPLNIDCYLQAPAPCNPTC